MSESEQDRVCIASISAPHGVRGDLKLRVYLENPSDLLEYSPLFFEDGSKALIAKVVRTLSDSVIASFSGVKDRDEALLLRGKKLYIMRDQLPDTDEGTYYHADLVGLFVESSKGEEVGVVKYVHNYGAGPILEIFNPSTFESLLIPFRNEAVPVVDLKSKKIIVVEAYLSYWQDE